MANVAQNSTLIFPRIMSQMGLQIPTYDENRSQVVHRGGRMQSRDNNRMIATIN